MQLFMTLLPYIFLVVSLAVCLSLFYGISQRMQKLRVRLEKCEARIQTESAQLATGIQSIKARVEDIEDGRPPADTTVSMTSSGSGFNSTVRSKVLKMHRLGQSPDKIAEALRVPKGEVDLLVKVHRIVMRPYEEGVSPVAERAAV